VPLSRAAGFEKEKNSFLLSGIEAIFLCRSADSLVASPTPDEDVMHVLNGFMKIQYSFSQP
jgi:hypothetical protein